MSVAVTAWRNSGMKRTAEAAPAAIIAEPIAANMGVVPPEGEFVAVLRDVATDSGALLILDEVITGFRVARGGAQELYGVEADLTVIHESTVEF